MNSQQDVIYDLMSKLEETLDSGVTFLGFSVVRKYIVTELLDRLYAALPEEIKEAHALLRRKDEFQYEAQQKAEKIISDAHNEANRLLSESDILRAVQKEAEKIKEQVINDCEEIKRKASDEAETIRMQAADEAARTQQGASVYAEQLLANLEQNLAQMQEIVKNGQVALERRRIETEESVQKNYANVRQEYSQNYSMSQ